MSNTVYTAETVRQLTLSDAVRLLDEKIPYLRERQKDFAKSLISQHRTRGLSFNQASWVKKLLEQVFAPAPVSKEIGSMTGVIALFDKVREKLQKPAITISAGELTLRLNVAGSSAKRPGTINVATPGGYGNNTWYGRITREGMFEPSGRAEVPQAVIDLVTEFAKDPAFVAARHGKTTGCCSFCTTSLSDERSLYAGYGETCAKNYGLPYPKKKDLAKLQNEQNEANALAVLEAELTERAMADAEATADRAQTIREEEAKWAARKLLEEAA